MKLINQIELNTDMREKKKLKEDHKVKEIVAKNQEVIDALKKLSHNISPESLSKKSFPVLDTKNDQIE